MDLARAVHPARLRAAVAREAYGCYFLSDVGGVVSPAAQRAVAAAMCALTHDGRGYDPSGRPCGGTLFAYITGDVVYYHGEPAHYADQFYAPYRDYDRPIFAIPGNHDGDPPGDGACVSLAGFIANFCAPQRAPIDDEGRHNRPALDQPNVYWTLEAPWLRIVGLYTNVPDGGMVDAEQRRWFLQQMARPRHGKHLIVALHHPPFSIDQMHGGSPQMLNLVHEPAKRAGCRLVVSGHAHTYQRFAFDDVTYVVNGAGGYFELHDLVSPPDPGTLTPVVAHTGEHSFMQVAVTPRELRVRTVAVPLPFEPTVGHPILVDEFRCPLATLSSVAATGRTQ